MRRLPLFPHMVWNVDIWRTVPASTAHYHFDLIPSSIVRTRLFDITHFDTALIGLIPDITL
jgi:hypothetical protein